MRIRHLVVPVLTAILLLSLALPPAPAAAAVISDALPSRWAGFYLPGCPLDVTSLSTLEGKVGASAAVVNYFQNISGGFTAVQAGRAADHGAIPLVTLEFWNGANGVNQPAYSLKKISGGSLDTYLRTFARSAKAFGRTIWLRPFHEMNGTWYPWCGTTRSQSTGRASRTST